MIHSIVTPFLLLFALLFPQTHLLHLADHASASLVRITTEGDVCSGFVIAPYRVLTANHCLGKDIRVDGSTKVEVLHADDYYDLALLATDSTKHPLTLSDAPLARYDEVVAVGYGFGFTRPTVSVARVMLLNYSPQPDMAPGLFVTSAYHGGMSGGPVLNQMGEVVGVVQRSGDGVGYGVGTLLIRAFLLGTE